MKVIDLDTEKGNEIFEALRRDGWKKIKEYCRLAFDKGIDFDSYTLRKEGLTLVPEWTNWSEWEISGSIQAIKGVAAKYALTIRDKE